MQVVVIGANHRSASVERRELLGVAVDAPRDIAGAVQPHVAEVFVLSTCNRVELYAVCGHERSGVERLRRILAGRSGLPIDVVRSSTYAYGHRAAVRQLLRVASALDSAVVGEHEIVLQVRRAIGICRDAGSLGPVLGRLTGAALACARRVRTLTGLGAQQRSIASEAVQRAVRVLGGSLNGRHVAVFGAGDVAASVLANLAPLKARVTLFNRTLSRSRTLAAVHGAESRPWDERCSALSDCDAVFVCTSSREHVLTQQALVASRRETTKPIVCVDLAVPRGVEPSTDVVPTVTLIGIDDLGTEPADMTGLAAALRAAEGIVETETDRFLAWWRNRSVTPTIARLRARADRIALDEVARTLRRLDHMTPHDREIVRELSWRIVAKLLHAPTKALREDAEGANMALVVERLFGLEAGDTAHQQRATESSGVSHTELHATSL